MRPGRSTQLRKSGQVEWTLLELAPCMRAGLASQHEQQHGQGSSVDKSRSSEVFRGAQVDRSGWYGGSRVDHTAKRTLFGMSVSIGLECGKIPASSCVVRRSIIGSEHGSSSPAWGSGCCVALAGRAEPAAGRTGRLSWHVSWHLAGRAGDSEGIGEAPQGSIVGQHRF